MDPVLDPIADEAPAGLPLDQKRFEHKGLGLVLELKLSAGEILQRHAEEFMVTYRKSKRGASVSEQYAKTLETAIACGWVVEPSLDRLLLGKALPEKTLPEKARWSKADVDGLIGNMRPPHVRWYSEQINAVYLASGEEVQFDKDWPIKPTRDQKTFEHQGLGLTLELKYAADDLLQRQIEKFMAAHREDKRGNSTPELFAKNIYAAILSKWIEAPQLALRDIGEMKRSHVRWYSGCIDAVFALADEIPPES